MSTDIKASTKIINDDYGIDTDDEIASFTLSHRLNNYWGARDLFTENYESILTEKDDKAVCDIYVFSRNKIIELQKINNDKNIGDDVTCFLNKLLLSNVKTFYIEIF